MGLHQIILAFLLLTSTAFAAIDRGRIVYLINAGHLEQAVNLYNDYKEELGRHDFELVQDIALIILQKGYNSGQNDLVTLSLFGSGVSANEKTQSMLEDGLTSRNPQDQIISLNFLARIGNDASNEAVNRAMRAAHPLIRLEAAFHLARMKYPTAVGQIESLMYKFPEEVLAIFPRLFAVIGDAHSIRIMKKLLNSKDEKVRTETILSAAEHKRDDLLPQIRSLATHHDITQQEACALALGALRDEKSLDILRRIAQSKCPSTRLAALSSLFQLGQTDVKPEIEALAREGDILAIQVLSKVPGSESTLAALLSDPNIQVRINAALALLDLKDRRAFLGLADVLIHDPRDLVFTKVFSIGRALHAWKAVPSGSHNLKENPVAFELSLGLREETLVKCLSLPEEDFLKIAHALFESQQNELIPTLATLLGNLNTPGSIALLKKHQQKAGAPLIRNYCNLALYKLKEEGPYEENLSQWILNQHNNDLIKFRPFIPFEMRDSHTPHELTPEETARLLIESYEAIAQAQNEKGVELLLKSITSGHPKNKYVLAGLLLRAIQ